MLNALFKSIKDFYAERKQKFEIEYEIDIKKLKSKVLSLESQEYAAQKNIDNLSLLKLQIEKELAGLNQKNLQSDKNYANLQRKNELKNQQIEITREIGLAELELVRNKETKKVLLAEMRYLENIRDNIEMITLVKPPTATKSPIKPNIRLNIALFTAAGFVLILFVSLFFDYIETHRSKTGQMTT